jgi:hypothetical protein
MLVKENNSWVCVFIGLSRVTERFWRRLLVEISTVKLIDELRRETVLFSRPQLRPGYINRNDMLTP